MHRAWMGPQGRTTNACWDVLGGIPLTDEQFCLPGCIYCLPGPFLTTGFTATPTACLGCATFIQHPAPPPHAAGLVLVRTGTLFVPFPDKRYRRYYCGAHYLPRAHPTARTAPPHATPPAPPHPSTTPPCPTPATRTYTCQPPYGSHFFHQPIIWTWLPHSEMVRTLNNDFGLVWAFYRVSAATPPTKAGITNGFGVPGWLATALPSLSARAYLRSFLLGFWNSGTWRYRASSYASMLSTARMPRNASHHLTLPIRHFATQSSFTSPTHTPFHCITCLHNLGRGAVDVFP